MFPGTIAAAICSFVKETPLTINFARILSDDYRRLNAELHRTNPAYGTTGRQYVHIVRDLARKYQIESILDYGCGKCDLWQALHEGFDVRNYDPALLGFDTPPEPAELVTCIDVLEHVEPEYLESTLADLVRVTLRIGFFTIATQPSSKRLADGTNCHRIVEDSGWWSKQLKQYFPAVAIDAPSSNGLQAVVRPKSASST